MSEELRLQRSQIHDFVGDDPDAVRVIEKLLKGYNTLISGGTGRSIGSIFPHGGTTPPLGSFVCDGSAISRANYSELFAVIGTTWGAGDGSTTFNVPDLSGAFLRGTGTGTINTRDKIGPAVGAFQEDQLQGHWHEVYRPVDDSRLINKSNERTDGPLASPVSTDETSADENRYNARDIYADGTNGTPRTGDETRPFAAGVLWCIQATNATLTTSTESVSVAGLIVGGEDTQGLGIVEQGSNDNGSYIVFSSGIQVCWGSASNSSHDYSAVGSIYRSPLFTHALPATFASAPQVWASTSSSAIWAASANNGVSSFHAYHVYPNALTSRTESTEFLAIGMAA